MSHVFERALLIFRRDLRLDDNTALHAACEQARSVVCCFFFDPRQAEPHPYFSPPALQFMVESLEELARELAASGGKLHVFYGEAEEELGRILAAEPTIGAVFINRDYTPFSRARDQALETVCASHNRKFFSFADAMLNEPGTVLKTDSQPYTMYTAYAKAAAKRPVAKPRRGRSSPRVAALTLGDDPQTVFMRVLGHRNAHLFSPGGRSEGLRRLQQIEALGNYAETRDLPAEPGTSGLSAHNKFGTISPRELYWRVADLFGEDHALIRELHWRDFFTQIGFHFPHVFGHAFNPSLDDLPWETDERLFDRWCRGETGFPIVDAGMRQLNETGWMHNRVRMITASFLTKDLLIDWRLGERYFAKHLIDYDPAVNNGNWQWAASTGCDAQPYFRIFNPQVQQKKFDPEGAYVRRWVTELAEVATRDLFEDPHAAARPKHYPEPIVDHAEQKVKAERLFQMHKEKSQ